MPTLSAILNRHVISHYFGRSATITKAFILELESRKLHSESKEEEE